MLEYLIKQKNRFIVFILIVALFTTIFTGCSKKSNVSDDGASKNVPADALGSDLLDPENNELNSGTGANVNADDLYHQNGKANGIDVSKWQGKIDWKKVKSEGIDFAIIRIGYRGENGVIYKDSYADYNIQQADAAGVLVGVYFFSTAVNSAEAYEEAKWTASAIQGYPISYPVVYDCEGFLNPDSRMYSVSNSQRTDNALSFLKYVTDSGYEGMLYAAKSELESSACWNTAVLQDSYKIWVARYTDVPYPQTPNPDYNGKYDMWQYTNMGSVNGIDGNTDMIVSYFTKEKATAKKPLESPGNASAPPQNDGVYSGVSDSVTAKAVTNLREAASTKSNIVATIKNGDFVPRTGIGSNGWSKLTYNGKTVYAITSYLTADSNYSAPSAIEDSSIDEFSGANEQVTAKDTVNLRDQPSTSGNIVASISNGQFVTRTGSNSKGWSRIEYNGQTVYAVTSYLTTEVNSTVTSSAASSESSGLQFSEVNEQVTAKSETNLRTEPSSKDDSTVIYTLKNGEYVTRTGISNNGWSRLNYNGQTVYAVSSYLTS